MIEALPIDSLCFKSSSIFERMRRKETKNEKRNTVKHKEVGNIEEIVFVVFVYISKTK